MLLCLERNRFRRASTHSLPQRESLSHPRKLANLPSTEANAFMRSSARELANSNILQCADAASVLTALQALFYQTRDELPTEVPDEEIIEALTNCYMDQGDAIDVAKIPTGELMAHSRAYRKAQEETERSSYSITDDTGRAYAFDPAEWDYDETAAGWDGERWDSCWNE